MCPSYRVTRDEQDSTRGRANTLRLALSGQLGKGALTSNEMAETLKLCVSCKACRRECPTGVDMARMKIEATHHFKSHHGFTLKDKLIAYLPHYASWAAKFASILNLRNQFPWLAKIAESMTGLSAQRSWPTWESHHFFSQPPSGVSKEEVLKASKPVVLFIDTFNGFFESHNASAAFGVLQAAGYSVHIAAKDAHSGTQGHLCCGRTFLANGMVEQARQQAEELVDALVPFAQKGIAIVGLEPSCLLTLRDEALVLGLGESAELVSQQAVLFEEFLANELKAGKLEVLKQNLKPAEKNILLHGHCHQKAFGLMPSVLEVIQLIPQAKPQLIESSCCGMAGSFGYEASHLDVSMQMAELSLLPAIRQQSDAIVVADGTSCRHQIADGAAREAIHVAKLLSDHLLRH